MYAGIREVAGRNVLDTSTRLDVLVHNPGHTSLLRAEAFSPEELAQHPSTNAIAPIHL